MGANNCKLAQEQSQTQQGVVAELVPSPVISSGKPMDVPNRRNSSTTRSGSSPGSLHIVYRLSITPPSPPVPPPILPPSPLSGMDSVRLSDLISSFIGTQQLNRVPAQETGLTMSQMHELEKVFRTFDTNGDGMLTVYEISAVLHKLGQSPSIPEIREMISSVDKDEKGMIDIDEFFQLMAKRTFNFSSSVALSEETLKKIFESIDKDKNQQICLEELMEALVDLGQSLSMKEVESMFNQADIDKDGLLNWSEFKNALMKKETKAGTWSRLRGIAVFNSLWKPTPSDPKQREKARLLAARQGRILKEVTFIRHGESQANLEFDLYGKDLFHWNPTLTEKGVNQAKAASSILKEELEKQQLEIELIVVSPLYRAVQTATLVLEDQIKQGTPFMGHPLATEQVTGSDDLGTTPEEIRKEWPQVDWSLMPDKEVWWWTPEPIPTTLDEARRVYQQNPMEEPWENTVRRAFELEEWLASRPENVIAVVAHGDFIEAMAGKDLDNAKFWTLEIEERKESKN